MAAGDLTITKGQTEGVDCAHFDGVDDYVEIPHSAAHVAANLENGLTVSAWVKAYTKGETNVGRILDKSTNTTAGSGLRFGTDSNGAIAIRINSGTGGASASGALIGATLQWVHVLGTCTAAGIINLYKNGTLSGTANQNGGQATSAITTTNAARIGTRSGATDVSFDGLIRDVRWYNRVLTQAEITKLAANEQVADGLIGHWPLKDDFEDKSGLGNHGTASGAYLVKTDFNRIVADIRGLNMAADTDKLIIQPVAGRNGRYEVTMIERDAA